MRSLSRMICAAGTFSLALSVAACSDKIEPMAPADVGVETPSLRIVSAPAGGSVTVGLRDTVRLSTRIQPSQVSWSVRNPKVLRTLSSGRVVALGVGQSYVVATGTHRRNHGRKDSTLVIVRQSGVGTPPETQPTPPAPPAPTPPPGSAQPVSGAYYVSPTGSDANAGTQSKPWRSIARALPRLQPGQTLYLRGGTYTEDVRNPSIKPGRPDARITVAAYPGERPVIVGLFWLTRPSYWTLDGVNVTWRAGGSSKDHMVKLTNGTGWVLQNSELWGARSFANLLVAGTSAGEPANWAVRDNCIHTTYKSNNTNQDHNMYVNTANSSGSGVIERNVLFKAPNGQNVKIGYGGRSVPQVGDGTSNVVVRYNTMHDALKNMSVSDYSSNNRFERNLVVKSTDGYAVRAYRLRGQNNVFRDNTFFGLNRLQYADGGYNSVTDASGNRMQVDPKFNGLTCSTFRPGNPAAAAYGHLAG